MSVQIFENWELQNSNCKYPITMMLVWDKGDSYGLTPFESNLLDNVKCDIPVKDMKKVNRVIVIGTNINRFIDING